MNDSSQRGRGIFTKFFSSSACARLVARLHRDQRGAVSLMTVLTLLLLVIVMGMVLNVGRQAASRVKLQNAADSGTYAGGIVLARSMNTVAFSNHLLCDVLALTAFLREGRDGNAASLVPEILDAWREAGKLLAKSGFPKFDVLGATIPVAADAEQKMVDSYSAWGKSWSDMLLPTLEDILRNETIPQFQRNVVRVAPEMAQLACLDLALRNRPTKPVRYQQRETPVGVLWRTSVSPVGGDGESQLRTLPVVDPETDDTDSISLSSFASSGTYLRQAKSDRQNWTQRYLNDWNSWGMQSFDSDAPLSQFGTLWRGFVNGQLRKLLNEDYPDSNLPHVIRTRHNRGAGGDEMTLERDYMFVGVAYRKQIIPEMPGAFHDSLSTDAQAFTQGILCVPQPRLHWHGPWWEWVNDAFGMPYQKYHPWGHSGFEQSAYTWDMFSQNWSFHIVPATSESIGLILQTQPQTNWGAGYTDQLNLPTFLRVTTTDLQRLTTH